jgi:hypothetical protein
MNDWVWWIWSLLFTPVTAGYYLWSSNAIDGVLRRLQQSEVVPVQEDDIKAIRGYFAKPWRRVLSFSVLLLVGVLYFISRNQFSGFAGSSLLTKLGTSFTYAVLSYFIAMLISNLVLNFWSIRRVVQGKSLNINPLHPDKSGGLKVLSDYSIKVVYLNAVFGILASVTGYRLVNQGYVGAAVLGVIFYVGVATVSFFSPLSTAHAEMDHAKTQLLLKLGKQFWDDYLSAHNAISGDAESLKDELAKIKQLQELYELTNNFPVWPFDTTTLRRFFITISSPLIPPLIGLLFDFLKKIYHF